MASWLKKDLPPLAFATAMLVALAAAAPTRDAAARPVVAAQSIFGCSMFPENSIWNVSVDSLPVDSHSDAWVHSIGTGKGLHTDFGSGTWDGGPIGIPYNASNNTTTKYDVDFHYGDESDPGPYPIPDSPLIEYSSDHHLLVVDQSSCVLHEMFDVSHNTDGSWSGGSGAIWDLNSNALRPADWTSADAAGLPILPGLVRYEEVEAGEINHAIRFTAHSTNSYIWPARHLTAGNPGVLTSTPPMGARFRLKASFDVSGYPAQMQVILRAMQKYGIILADNGSDWFITGAPDSRWDNDMLHLLDDVTGEDFEAVDESGLMVSADSGATSLSVTISGNAGVGGATLTYAGGPSTLAADEPALEASTPDAALTDAGNSATTPEASLPAIDPAKLSFQQVATGLASPVFVTNAGDGTGRLFILEKPGRIRIVKNGSLLTTPFLNISSKVRSTGGEQGLLGLAFHPSYGSNGYFYVAYTAPRPNDSVGSILTLERYSVSAINPDVADQNSGGVVLTIQHPSQNNHNGGMLAFGPDGYLYWSAGDGGSGGDPPNNAQTKTVLLGKILRLDVDSGSPYAVPPTNPFFSSGNANSMLIWAWGLRNPWRYSFDRLTGDLYIGDVGQNLYEEVDFQPAGDLGGENYGWRLMEGLHCYDPSTNCDPGNATTHPVVEYPHNPECSITGGYVYRGSNFPSLVGRYFYGDYCSGKVWGLHNDGGWIVEQLVDTPYSISSFGQDESGDLYLVDLGGSVYRIVYQEAATRQVDVYIAGGLMDNYVIPSGTTLTAQYPGVQNGPLEVNSHVRVFTSQRSTYGPASSFNEVLGYPDSQLTNHYWFTWYDQVAQQTWVLVGNPSPTLTAHVTIKIAAWPVGTYDIPPNGRIIPTFPGWQAGPVEVISNNPVFTSERSIYGPYSTFTEVLGYPDNQVTNHYWFTWYDQVAQQTWVLVGNPSPTLTAHVTIKIAAWPVGTYDIPPNGRILPTFPGWQAGPVEVISDNPVFTSERSIYGPASNFEEVLGYPDNQLTNRYWFTWYDNVDQSTWVLVGNPSNTQTAHVKIKIAGLTVGTYVIPPNGRALPTYSGVQSGPVEVVSDIPVFTSERSIYGPYNTFNEVLGFPHNQLATHYWFTWYDDVAQATSLLIGVP